MAGTTGLEPATSDVTVKRAEPSFLFVCLSFTVLHGSNHGSNSTTNRDDSTGRWTHDSARVSGWRIIALGLWMPWKHVFEVLLLHFAFKSEVRGFLKLPIGARKIPATGAQGARTLRVVCRLDVWGAGEGWRGQPQSLTLPGPCMIGLSQ